MSEKTLLTQEGYDKIVAEHEYLVSVRRKEVAEHLKEARSYGDLSENAEYDAAKNEQAELEEKIQKLEAMMRDAQIIDHEELTLDVVGVSLSVTVKNVKTKDIVTYKIVPTPEADPFAEPVPRLSHESAIGKELLGKKVGDHVKIEVPNGDIVELEVQKIFKEE